MGSWQLGRLSCGKCRELWGPVTPGSKVAGGIFRDSQLSSQWDVSMGGVSLGDKFSEGVPGSYPPEGRRLMRSYHGFLPVFHSDSQATPICQAPLGESVPNMTGNCLHLTSGVDIINHTPVDLRANTTCL